MTEESAAPSASQRFLTFAREHPGLLFSGGYLAATGIGMLTSWTFYSEFGIDVFVYAQVSDFLLAAFRHPLATLATLVAVPAVLLVMRSDRWMDNRFGWYKYLYGTRRIREWSRSRAALALYCVLYAFAFSGLYSNRMASSVREGGARPVEAQLLGGTYLGRDATEPFDARLLGSTASFVFLYDQTSGRVAAVPVENVARLSPR